MTLQAETESTPAPAATEAQNGNETPGIDLPEGSAPASADEADDSVEVSIGGESPPQDEEESRAPEWVRELRKNSREKDREIRELKQKLQGSAPATVPVLGQKPTLESCEYDEQRFETELDNWKERKSATESKAEQERKDAESAQADWKSRLDLYGVSKTALKVRDFDDAEAAAIETFSSTQQAILVKGADNSAVLIYALGKNPKMAKELAAITDPVQFAFAAAKLETKLKVTPRKTTPLPESTVRGSAQVSGAVDSTLARLEAEAAKSGDRSQVIAHKRRIREKA